MIVIGEVFDIFFVCIILVYVKGFKVIYIFICCLVDISDLQKEGGEFFYYVFVFGGMKFENIFVGYIVIEIFVKSVICMIFLQLFNFIKLDVLSYVVGIMSICYFFNKEMNECLKQGKMVKIGIEGNFDNEVIMSVNFDVIFIFFFKCGGYDVMCEVGILLVLYLGYKEMILLGQVEWIKFIGFFIGEEEIVNWKFVVIEKYYNELKERVVYVKKCLVVFSGEICGGNWYVVGGKSFLVQFFCDVGVDYFLKDDFWLGGVIFDFEIVYSQVESVDYWCIVNSFDGIFFYDVLKSEDLRYVDFCVFCEKGVIYCNMCEKLFYESMFIQLEVVLEDLIKVFYLDLLFDYMFVYYE